MIPGKLLDAVSIRDSLVEEFGPHPTDEESEEEMNSSIDFIKECAGFTESDISPVQEDSDEETEDFKAELEENVADCFSD